MQTELQEMIPVEKTFLLTMLNLSYRSLIDIRQKRNGDAYPNFEQKLGELYYKVMGCPEDDRA